jgi:hypothetical protein
MASFAAVQLASYAKCACDGTGALLAKSGARRSAPFLQSTQSIANLARVSLRCVYAYMISFCLKQQLLLLSW